jgi:hypothetical protein
MAKQVGRGAKLYWGDTTGPTNFVELIQCESIGEVSAESQEIEVTDLASTAREYLAALADSPEITFALQWDPLNGRGGSRWVPDSNWHLPCLCETVRSGAIRESDSGETQYDSPAFGNYHMELGYVSESQDSSQSGVRRYGKRITWRNRFFGRG